MRLIQKKFLFQDGERISPNAVETDGLKLVVNGINTDLSITELIYSSKVSAGYLKGWSFLEMLTDPDDKENFNSLELKDNKFEIGFVGPTGNFYQIYAIEDPTFQYPEKDIEENEVDRIIALLHSTQPGQTPESETPESETPESETPESETPEPETPEPETPESETPKADLKELVSGAAIPEAKTESESDNGAVTDQKTADAEAGTHTEGSEVASEPGEAEAEAAPKSEEKPEENEEYSRTRFALERNGYKEYSSDNFKLFGKLDAEPYLLVIKDNSVEELEIEEMEITDEFADYFTTYQDKEIVFRFIIASEELTILDPKPETA